jgi:hypothetical protein
MIQKISGLANLKKNTACHIFPMLYLKPECHHSVTIFDYSSPALEPSMIVVAGKLLPGVDVSARLNAKLAG